MWMDYCSKYLKPSVFENSPFDNQNQYFHQNNFRINHCLQLTVLEELRSSSTNFLGLISLPDLLVGAVWSVEGVISVLAFFGWLSVFSSVSVIEVSISSAFLFVPFPFPTDVDRDLKYLMFQAK